MLSVRLIFKLFLVSLRENIDHVHKLTFTVNHLQFSRLIRASIQISTLRVYTVTTWTRAHTRICANAKIYLLICRPIIYPSVRPSIHSHTHIHRERERERETHTHTHTHTHRQRHGHTQTPVYNLFTDVSSFPRSTMYYYCLFAICHVSEPAGFWRYDPFYCHPGVVC